MPKDKCFNKKSQKFTLSSMLLAFSSMLLALCFLYPDTVSSGPYLDSAHGKSSYGVSRTSISSFGYSVGNCAHCHEQHASVGGAEPAPTGGPDKYALFYTNHINQTDNVCFKCHTDLSSFQTGGLINRSYSYRAGGYADSLNDIKEAFSFVSPATSHNLGNILTFINGRWGFTNDSNPCAACHNPHAAKGDPANSPNSSKSSVTRGYSPVSRPSLHSKDNNAWGLWGDDSTERMSNYTANYQAPYRYGSTTAYEPDGSVTIDGSNLTDFVTFCTDCHNTSNTIYSTTLGRNLRTIDWNNEKHGKGNAEGAITVDAPYSSTMGYVLSCTDCHEPHGAPNAFLIRKEVNGGTLGATISTFPTTNWKYICARCHQEDTSPCSTTRGPLFEVIHHGAGTDRPYTEQMCGPCHGSGGSCPPTITCSNCHYHGSVVNTGIDYAPTNRRTF